MTQPRREQIKDINAKFSILDSRLTATSGSPLSPALGLAQSSTFNLPVVSGISPYQAFVDSTVTKQFGGVVETSPGVLLASIPGPYIMAANQQISITVPQLNNGNPIPVVIQASDIVTIAGSSLLTTSRLAARINAVVAPYYVVAFGSTVAAIMPPVASDCGGYLRIRTPTDGDDASITIRDVTAGLLNVFFAASSSPSISVTGSTAPKRGIVTISPDGLGGVAHVRLANGEPCLTRQTKRIHMGAQNYLPDNAVGQDIYAKVTGVAGKSATLSFYTYGRLQPSVVTKSSNFTTLNATDTLTITISDPTFTNPISLSVNFSGVTTSTTVSAIVDMINVAWYQAATAAWTGQPAPNPRLSTLVIKKASFLFPTGSSFKFQLNGATGAATVTVPLSPSITTPAQLSTAINNAITSAGQTSQGSSSISGGFVMIVPSGGGNGPTTLNILPGDPPTTFSPPDMRALNEMGISPGLYSGSTIAQLNGDSEIRVYNPSRSVGAALSISGSSLTLAKFGLSGPVSAVVTLGEEPAVPGSEVKILLPEAMEFGEVPDNQDGVVERFLMTNYPTSFDPALGIQNMGMPAILGPDGKLPIDIQSRVLTSFSDLTGLSQIGAAALPAWQDGTNVPAESAQAQLSDIVTMLASKSADPHGGAGRIGVDNVTPLADSTQIGNQSVRGALDSLTAALARTTTSSSAVRKIGAEVITGVPNGLAVGTVFSQSSQLLGYVNGILSSKAAPDGLCDLGPDGKIPLSRFKTTGLVIQSVNFTQASGDGYPIAPSNSWVSGPNLFVSAAAGDTIVFIASFSGRIEYLSPSGGDTVLHARLRISGPSGYDQVNFPSAPFTHFENVVLTWCPSGSYGSSGSGSCILVAYAVPYSGTYSCSLQMTTTGSVPSYAGGISPTMVTILLRGM